MSIGKPMGKRLLLCLCTAVGGLLLWSAPALACPNGEMRGGFSANLPDCRAYEMVSPPAKNGYGATTSGQAEEVMGQASAAGDAIAYMGDGPFPGSAAGALGFYRASRGQGGWSMQALLPAQAYSFSSGFLAPAFAAYSSDLSKSVLIDATDSPPLVSGEQPITSVGSANLFLRDNVSGNYSLLNFPAPGVEPLPYGPTFDGASADFTTVIFDANGKLTPEAPGGGVDNLYEWAGGAVSLVSQIPPAGQVSCGPAGPACEPVPHGGTFGGRNAHKGALGELGGSLVRAISSDGSRIFFTAEGNLYVRENGATTVRVDASQAQPPGPGGGGVWATAAGDGSKVFFFDDASASLTNDTVPGSGRNLYGYDTHTGALTDLTPVSKPEVLGVVNEASTDGSYLYFAARGDLTGEEENSLHGKAQAGGENLYLSHEGVISFIDTINDPSEGLYGHKLGTYTHNASRVTADGRHLAFFAKDSDSRPNGFIGLYAELFEYNAESGQLVELCKECVKSEFGQLNAELLLNQVWGVFQYNRGLSEDGKRVFFESEASLLPADTNGQPDVYEYELDGTGGCTASPGCLYLVSTGTSTNPSEFADASASGEDVFFGTTQQLVPSDVDGAVDIYDARVGGGIPRPPEPSCLSNGCLTVPPAPLDATPGSLTFSGAGNVPGEVKAQIAPKANLTNAQKLATAVKGCAKKRKSQRKRCEAQARKHYGKKARKSARTQRAGIIRRAGK